MFMAYPKPAPESLLIEQSPEGLAHWCAARRRAGETIGLVPTMRGIRHRGEIQTNLEHLSHLIKAASWLSSLDLPVRLIAIPEGALQGFNDEVLDLDHEDASVTQRHRALGELQPAGHQRHLGRLLAHRREHRNDAHRGPPRLR